MKINATICPQCGAGVKIGPGAHRARCEYCDTEIVVSGETTSPEVGVVFAKWNSAMNLGGYYYPAHITEMDNGQLLANFLDGDSGIIADGDTMDLQEAFNVLEIQGNWQFGGFFYKGRITNRNPVVMSYNDGHVEQVQLSQLRGRLPKALRKKK